MSVGRTPRLQAHHSSATAHDRQECWQLNDFFTCGAREGGEHWFARAMAHDERPSLSALLAGQEAGTWVVWTADMATILSTARTPEEAIEKAHIQPPSTPPM